tara:strand:- start:218 stop:517 length:300 start_codon:yes stop_codon:yes gene_type:complete
VLKRADLDLRQVNVRIWKHMGEDRSEAMLNVLWPRNGSLSTKGRLLLSKIPPSTVCRCINLLKRPIEDRVKIQILSSQNGLLLVGEEHCICELYDTRLS